MIGRRRRCFGCVVGRLSFTDRLVLVVAVEFLLELIVICLNLGDIRLKLFAIVFFLCRLGSLLCRVDVFLRELDRLLRPFGRVFVVARFGVRRGQRAENVRRFEFG